AVEVAGEDQVAGGRHDAPEGRIIEPRLALELASYRVDRLDGAAEAFGVSVAAAGEPGTRVDRAALVHEVLLLLGEYGVAAFLRRNEQQVELRIVGARLPVFAAKMRRAQRVAVRVGAVAMAARGVFLDVLRRVIVERAPGLGIEAGRPVQLVDILLAGHE